MKNKVRNRARIDVIDLTGRNSSLSRPIQRTLMYCAQKLKVPHAEVCVLLVRKDRMQKLNHEYRGMNRPTDVLSFPQSEPPFEKDSLLGDIVISAAIARSQAREAGKPFSSELLMLSIHGLLHLLGHDHAKKDEAKVMFELQEKLLQEALKIV